MMAKKSQTKNPFEGRWRITWMDQWDQDFIDEEVEGFFEFGPKNSGSFHFGYVQAQVDYRQGIRDDHPCLDFTFNGNDEMTPTQGRGWAVLEEDEINGMIFFHQGDESEFKAVRTKRK